MRGESALRVITGRGWGNAEQKPVLRKKIEAWLRDDGRRRFGVLDVLIVSKGGALDLRLRPPGTSTRPTGERDERDAAQDQDTS